MAVTINKSVVDDSDVLSNERVVDMNDTLQMLHDDTTQFVTLLNKVATKEAHSSKIEWLEDQLFPRLSSLSISLSSGAASMTVPSGEGSYFRQGDIVRVADSNEAVGVSAAPATDVVGITRSVGQVAAATAAAAGELVIIGNASQQGASLGVRAVTKRVAAYNYTQIFRHPYGFTNTLTASELYTGNEPMKERAKKGIEHRRAIEYSLFWGAREFYTGAELGGATATEPTTVMGGVYEYLSTFKKDPAGQMTKDEFEGFMRDLLQYGNGQNKILFAAPLVAQIISGYARDNWVRSRPGDTNYEKWGVRVDGYISGAFGYEVPVIVKRDWNEFGTTASRYGSWAFVIDAGSVKLRPLKGRNTKLLLNRQGNSDDQTVEEYLTETSFEVAQEKKHGIISNATS